MFMFNEAISELGLVEIPLQGRKFTWSNMQPSPLLEKLDWVFTSNNWTLTFPSTTVKVLGMTPSDHCPCLVTFSTVIPRSKIFRFENFWLQHSGFSDVLTQSWAIPTQQIDPAKALTAKFKFLRKALKEWQAGWTGLKNLISNVKLLLQFLEVLGEFRDLSLEEWNFKNILKDYLLELLEQQRIYWKQRGVIKWVKLGDAGTKFFHANATLRHRTNLISQLVSPEGFTVTAHKDKELIIWEDFRHRLGVT
jgi:hypothetical protein